MDINRKTNDVKSVGFAFYEKLRKSNKQEIITIVFTKGKLDLEVSSIDRVNVYDNSMNIFFKDDTSKAINIYNITYME